MKVISKKYFEGYEFYCPGCDSKLEAKAYELKDVSWKHKAFYCPACKRVQVIDVKLLIKIQKYRNV